MLTGASDTVDAGARVWVPIAEAASLQNPPVSRQAMHKRVTALVNAGRLSTKPGPRNTVLVNIVALNRAIAEETDPAQALRNAGEPAAAEDEPADAAEDEVATPASNGGGASYHTSRANREAYQAENARLDLEERLNLIAYVDAVDRHTMAATRKIRDRLLGLPAVVADRVMAATEARAVRAILTGEIRSVLALLESDLMQMDEDDAGDELDDEPSGAEREAAAA